MISPSLATHLVKLAIGISILGSMLLWVDVRSLTNSIGQMDPMFFIGALILANCLIIFQAFRQYCILTKFSVSWLVLVRVQYIATFIGNFLPASLGIDAYKVYFLRQYSDSLLDSGKLVILDRFGGMLTATGFGLLALWFQPEVLHRLMPTVLQSTISVFLVIALLLFGLFIVCLLTFIRSKWGWLRGGNLRYFCSLNVVVYAVQVAKFVLLCQVFKEDVSPIIFAQVLLVHQFVALIPVSIGGLGVIEGSIVVLLMLFGLPVTTATAIALGNRLTMVFVSFIGGFFWLKVKPAASAQIGD